MESTEVVKRNPEMDRYVNTCKIASIREESKVITSNEKRALKLLPYQHYVESVDDNGGKGFLLTKHVGPNKKPYHMKFSFRVEYYNFITKTKHTWYFGKI